MSELTLTEMARIMRECAGEDETVDLAEEALGDADLGDLGYDSLALLEATGRVQREFGVALPEDALAGIHTLNQFVAVVNARLAPAARGAE
ncbi:acyl carrier protein [Streptomyces sp. NPDC055036]